MIIRRYCVLFFFLIALCIPTGAAAQDRAIHWDRYDVAITMQENGDLRVVETHDLVIDRGTFRTGSRSFDTGQFGRIRDIKVSEDGEPYRTGTEQPGTFTASDNGERFQLNYVFRDPDASSHTMSIAYTIGRALVEDGDRVYFDWYFFCSDSGCPRIDAGAITLQFPANAGALDVESSTSGVDVAESQSGRTWKWELDAPIQSEQLNLTVTFSRSVLAQNAVFRSESSQAPSSGNSGAGGPQQRPSTTGSGFSPLFCFAMILLLVILFMIMRASVRRRGMMPGPRTPSYPWDGGGFGFPRRRRRRWDDSPGGFGIPPIIVTPPFGDRDRSGGPFGGDPTTPYDGGGSSWDDSGGGSSWGDSGGGGSSWGDSGGGGSSWSDSSGGGSSWGGSSDSGSSSGGGSNDSSSFG